MHRVVNRGVLMLAVVASTLGVAVSGAQAKTKPVMPKKAIVVTGGQVTVTPTASTVSFLTSHGITVSALSPATLSSATVTFPVAGGVATNHHLKGVLFLRGGVSFANAKRTVKVRHLTVVRTGHKTWLAATVNHKVMVP